MCAIYGIIGQNNIELLKKMSKSQIFRGPDSQDFIAIKRIIYVLELIG